MQEHHVLIGLRVQAAAAEGVAVLAEDELVGGAGGAVI